MPDTGSIIVGGLNLSGTKRHQYREVDANKNLIRIKKGNYGKSRMQGTDYLYTQSGTYGGHGIDISAPAEGVWTTKFTNHSNNYFYQEFSGTSGATPIVGGIAALMLSVRPDLTALEVRKKLRESEQASLLQPENTSNGLYPMAGMVNAQKAVTDAQNISNKSGLNYKFYSSTIFPPETMAIYDSSSLQNTNIPYKFKTQTGLNVTTASPDPLNTGLKYSYITNVQGQIDLPETGTYYFRMLHDDQTSLKIDGKVVIANKRTTEGYSEGSINISNSGFHSLEVIQSQETGNNKMVLEWKLPSSGSYASIPSSNFTRTTENITASNGYKSGVIARFFNSTSIPVNFVDNLLDDGSTNIVSTYFNSNVYSNLNFYNTPLSSGDQFNIGRSDDFSAYFSGLIKLPSGYPAGNYTIKIGHDDGAIFYFNGQQKFNKPNWTPIYSVDYGTSDNLQTGVYYPFGIHYQELFGNSDLKMTWVKPNGVEEVIPTSAFFH